MDEHPLPMVRLMVDYFYNGDYKDEIQLPDSVGNLSTVPVLSLHASMYNLADKYDIIGLQKLAAKNFSKALRRGSDIVEFFDSLPEIYKTPEHARDIRDVALDFAREQVPKYITSPEDKMFFDEVLAETPEFMKELLDSFLAQPLMGYCAVCGFNKLVSVEAMQCRCRGCGGLASTTRRGMMYARPELEERYIGV